MSTDNFVSSALTLLIGLFIWHVIIRPWSDPLCEGCDVKPFSITFSLFCQRQCQLSTSVACLLFVI